MTPHSNGRQVGGGYSATVAVLMATSLVLATPAYALDPDKALSQYVRDVWRTIEGLPQDSVYALVQTRDGFLWFGTQEGLVRFNGANFVVFDRSNTKALVTIRSARSSKTRRAL